MEENARSRNLIEKLLRHPAFGPFLDDLSRDPALVASTSKPSPSTTQQSVPATPAQQTMPTQQQLPDVPETSQAPHIGMVLMPEQPDISMLNLNSHNDSWPVNGLQFNFNSPQVYAVLDLPEQPVDIAALAGKGDSFDASTPIEDSKVEYPTARSVAVESKTVAPDAAEAVDQDFSDMENDPSFALYMPSASPPSKTLDDTSEIHDPIFGDINPEKAFAHYELYIPEQQSDEDLATGLARLEAQCAKAEACCQRILTLTGEFDA